MTQTLVIRPSVSRGFVSLSPFDCPQLDAQLREWPGAVCRYRNREYRWEVPAEFSDKIQLIAATERVKTVEDFNGLTFKYTTQVSEDAYPYQKDAVSNALSNQSYMFNFEMGMGKTRTAIMCLKELGESKRTLIICPAIVRDTWRDEIQKWWPEYQGGTMRILPGYEGQPGAPFHFDNFKTWIVSYEMLKRMRLDCWDNIILDESQMIANNSPGKGGAQRTKLCHQLRKDNPHSFRLCLTATPMNSEPQQIYSQWNWLYPSRFGSWTAFTKRYCNVEDTGWVTASGNPALRSWGINKQHAEELQMRLSAGMARATKKEYAHLLPPFTAQTLRVDRPHAFNPRELAEKFLRSDLHNVDAEEFIRLHSVNKISVVANEALVASKMTPRVMVLTYLHKTAHLIGAEIAQQANCPVEVITGETVADKRIKRLKEIGKLPRAVVVASMSGIATGIDLTPFTTIYAAELHPSPGLMEQVAGRFHRLNSQEPVNFYWVIISGSYEEKVAATLNRRLNDQKSIVGASMTSGAMLDSFSDKRSDEDFRDHLNSLLSNVHSDEELGGYV